MNSNAKTSVEIRKSAKGFPTTPAVIDVHEWRVLYKSLLKKFPKGKVPYKELGKVDDYYLTRAGGLELYKVKQGEASLTKTARAVKALEKWFELQDSARIKKRVANQGLVIPEKS